MSICAVIVAYKPDLEVLRLQLDALAPQVSFVILVDNGSNMDLQAWYNTHQTKVDELILLDQNKGVGAAHNIGIQWAHSHGAEFVLLMDQDSVPMPDMVIRLMSAYAELTRIGVAPAALGPQFHDGDKGSLSHFAKIGFLGFTRITCNQTSTFVEADMIVSSGSLVPLKVIETVGAMDESLFIDHVDIEWCLRAKAKGFRIFGVCDALMTHTLGEQRKEIWFLRQRMVHFHQPFRYYYMFRNSVLLYRRGYIPWNWKLSDFVNRLKIMVLFCFIAPNRFSCLKMMMFGLYDGLRGIDGKLND